MSRSVRRRVSRLVAPACEPIARRRLQTLGRKANTPEEIVDVAFDFSFGGVTIRPYQVRSELRQFIELVRSREPRTILEVGTANGGTLFALAQVCAADALVVSIDLPGGPFGGGYPGWRRSLYQSFVQPNQRLVLLLGDSHTDEMVTTVQHALDGRALDVILIDADHSYGGVRRDFENYSRFIAPGGLVAFHDIVPESASRVQESVSVLPSDEQACPGDVSRFWAEIRQTRPSTEFVEDWRQGGFGIGVLELAAGER
jgi:predicted O-methyltransferase YrrM